MNIDEINREILTLEKGQTTFVNCEKLAQLYVVRDHLTADKAQEPTPRMSGSEFMTISSGVDTSALLRILDEHMESIRLIYPKEYASIIKKISALK